MSLANVLAAAASASSLVLLGDPQQLDQPLQGSHPPGADRSALAHLLGERATIADDAASSWNERGASIPISAPTPRRSSTRDRLEPQPNLAVQLLRGGGPTRGTGPRLVEVDHEGNDNESAEEADAVARLARSLVEGGATWTDQDGVEQPIGWREIVIVAAYNAQVGAIKKLLPEGGPGRNRRQVPGPGGADLDLQHGLLVGRGRAPRHDVPLQPPPPERGTSRARCVAVVVASPRLLRVRARSPEEMRLANALARFAEMAGWSYSAAPRAEPVIAVSEALNR